MPVAKEQIRQIIADNNLNSCRAKSSAIIYSIAETAKANNLKPYDYFEYLPTEIPKHLHDSDRSFLDDLLPWSPSLPATCRKPGKYEVK